MSGTKTCCKPYTQTVFELTTLAITYLDFKEKMVTYDSISKEPNPDLDTDFC